MIDEELRAVLDAMRRENADAHIATRVHTDERFAEAGRHSEELFAQSQLRFDEMRRHVDVRFGAMHSDIRLLAEALAHVHESLDRRLSALESRDRGFCRDAMVCR